MTTQTPYRCVACGSPVVRVTEDDREPPWQESSRLVCSDGRCGLHHEAEHGKLGRMDGTGRTVDVSAEEAREWQSRGGCPGVCARAYPRT